MDKFMDEDDRCKKAVVFTRDLPRIGLKASCSFPHFLMFLRVIIVFEIYYSYIQHMVGSCVFSDQVWRMYGRSLLQTTTQG